MNEFDEESYVLWAVCNGLATVEDYLDVIDTEESPF